MTTQRTNSNFYQIAKTDVNGNVIGITNISISDINIAGGSNGQVLTTDGAGNLSWGPGGGGGVGAIQPIIEFTGSVGGGAFQSFSDANLANFVNNTYAAVYVNGVLQLLADYTIVGSTLTLITPIPPSASVSVGPTSSGGSVTSVTGTGSGLGFSLAGTVTSSGSITLNVPTSSTLLTNLGISNVANYPALNGDANKVLTGAGTWVQLVTKGHLMAYGGSLPPGIYPANTAFKFSTVASNSGGITYNTSTGILTLPGGSTYRLTATLQSTVNSSQYASGDITFIWQYANSTPIYANTETIADSFGSGSTYVSSQATNEIIFTTSINTDVKVAMFYPMDAALYDVNYVRLIAQQL